MLAARPDIAAECFVRILQQTVEADLKAATMAGLVSILPRFVRQWGGVQQIAM